MRCAASLSDISLSPAEEAPPAVKLPYSLHFLTAEREIKDLMIFLYPSWILRARNDREALLCKEAECRLRRALPVRAADFSKKRI